MISILTQTEPVSADVLLLTIVSRTFRTLRKYNEDVSKFKLDQFTHSCVSHFCSFAEIAHTVDMKIPEAPVALNSFVFHEHVKSNWIRDFFESKTPREILELLFLSQYVDCPLLFHLCCIRLACWIMIPQHVIMSELFGFSITQPSVQTIQCIKELYSHSK
jgi:hypothetical protein